MRMRSLLVVLTLLIGGSGCWQLPTRKPPSPPHVAAPSAPGDQKLMLELMRQMADDDARSARK